MKPKVLEISDTPKKNTDNHLDLHQNEPTKTRKTRIFLWIVMPSIVLSILLLVAPIASFLNNFIKIFNSYSGLSNEQIINIVKQGKNGEFKQTNNQTNFLILGVDEIVGQKEGSKLTDTIIIANLNHNKHQLKLISLPRDLWIEEYKTKINSLYYYGNLYHSNTGKEFTSKIITDITNIPIHYTFIINLESLKHIVNVIGGVDIDVKEAFVDDKFPRADVDLKTAKPSQLYETISFNQGINHMDGETAMKYIRSRHSKDLSEGTDGARNNRQQELIMAIIQKMKSREVIINPKILGELYTLFRTKMDVAEITDQEIVSLAIANGKNIPTINSIPIPIDNTTKGEALIYHPAELKQDQWVYLPRDMSWQKVKEYLTNQLAN